MPWVSSGFSFELFFKYILKYQKRASEFRLRLLCCRSLFTQQNQHDVLFLSFPWTLHVFQFSVEAYTFKKPFDDLLPCFVFALMFCHFLSDFGNLSIIVIRFDPLWIPLAFNLFHLFPKHHLLLPVCFPPLQLFPRLFMNAMLATHSILFFSALFVDYLIISWSTVM